MAIKKTRQLKGTKLKLRYSDFVEPVMSHTENSEQITFQRAG